MTITQAKRGQCLAGQKQNKGEKTNIIEKWKWEDKEKPMAKKECTLEADVLIKLEHGSTPYDNFKRLQEWMNF